MKQAYHPNFGVNMPLLDFTPEENKNGWRVILDFIGSFPSKGSVTDTIRNLGKQKNSNLNDKISEDNFGSAAFTKKKTSGKNIGHRRRETTSTHKDKNQLVKYLQSIDRGSNKDIKELFLSPQK